MRWVGQPIAEGTLCRRQRRYLRSRVVPPNTRETLSLSYNGQMKVESDNNVKRLCLVF